jgi:hypothetical protein
VTNSFSSLAIASDSSPSPSFDGSVRIDHSPGGQVSYHNGKTTFAPASGGTVQADRNKAHTSGKITEFRREGGAARLSGALSENSIVNVNGIETSVKAALASGLIVGNGDGSYSVAGEQAPAAQMPDQTDPALADMEALGDTAAETSLTEVCTKASPAEVLGVVNALANGEGISERHVGKIASQMGIEPGEAMERAQVIHQAFVGQAMDTIGKSGLDAQEVVNWAWENRPDLMKKAISRHAADRTTKGYGDVVKAYLGGLEKASPQTILNAKLPPGCTARKGKDGTIIVNTPHGEFSWQSLLRMGAVSVRRG